MVDLPIPYLQVPARIVNQALDRIGADEDSIIGDIGDGTRVAEAARRNYGQALRQLLRTAHWSFARKQAVLTLLGDATGQSAPPVSKFVESPWAYAYAWPLDGVQGRWLPWNPTNAQPLDANGVPLTTGSSVGVNYALTPGRFLVGSSDQYPLTIGQTSWNQMPDLQRTEGLGPTSRKVILTDCSCAHFVYTRLVATIEEWDDLFREAMVMMMAMVLLPVAIKDPKLRLAEKTALSMELKTAIADARVANANEVGWPQSTDFEASFIRARNQGAFAYVGGAGFSGSVSGLGGFGYGYDQLSWGGSVY